MHKNPESIGLLIKRRKYESASIKKALLLPSIHIQPGDFGAVEISSFTVSADTSVLIRNDLEKVTFH